MTSSFKNEQYFYSSTFQDGKVIENGYGSVTTDKDKQYLVYDGDTRDYRKVDEKEYKAQKQLFNTPTKTSCKYIPVKPKKKYPIRLVRYIPLQPSKKIMTPPSAYSKDVQYTPRPVYHNDNDDTDELRQCNYIQDIKKLAKQYSYHDEMQALHEENKQLRTLLSHYNLM